MFQRLSYLEIVALKPFKFPFLARHPLSSLDRLGNPELPFPIGVTYGDRDYFGSDNGAEEIIKNSKFFTSGRSQLFKVANCSHYMPTEQP